MAKSNKIRLSDFAPQKTDVITFDSNILIKLLYPTISEKAPIAAYEDLYAKILRAGSSLIISSVQISEFVNRCIRFQFALFKDSENNPALDFKRDYRSTKDYSNSMKAILDIIQTYIIPNYTFVDVKFSNMQNDKIFRYGFSYDFNDSVLLEIAKQYKSILVTDDADFGNYDSNITIVTNNRKLLMFS